MERVADELGQVIELRPGVDLDDEKRALHRRRRPPDAKWCLHGTYMLDEETQRAYCRKCEREVPLFDVLDELAHSMERFIMWRQEAQHRAKVAGENAKELERVEQNAKARLRRLRKLGATVEFEELQATARRALRAYPGKQLVCYAADEGTMLEVRRHLRGSEVVIDPLMSLGSWRFAPA